MPHDKTPDTPAPDNGVDELQAIIASLWIREDQPDGCDTDSFLVDLESADITESKKREFIHNIWYILETIIRVRLGLDPTQNVLAEQFKQSGNPAQNMVNSTPQAKKHPKRKEVS